jgi:hypothetical protein
MKKINFYLLSMVLAAITLLFQNNSFAEDYYYKKVLTVPTPEIPNQDEYVVRENRTNFWIIGAGAMVEKLPISIAEYTLPLIFVAYENIHKKSIGDFDFSWAIGFYDLIPELEFALTVPLKPFDIKISFGGYYDFIIGGNTGMLVKGGIIVNKTIGMDLIWIPIGTQPTVSYSQSLKQKKFVENDGSHGLNFPIMGVLVSYRI